MHPITASELDLAIFFEAEPELLNPNAPWIYNEVLYQNSTEDLSISFAVSPSYKDVRLILKSRDVMIFELTASSVDDVRYRSNGGDEILEIILDACTDIELRIRPSIEIKQNCHNEP